MKNKVWRKVLKCIKMLTKIPYSNFGCDGSVMFIYCCCFSSCQRQCLAPPQDPHFAFSLTRHHSHIVPLVAYVTMPNTITEYAMKKGHLG